MARLINNIDAVISPLITNGIFAENKGGDSPEPGPEPTGEFTITYQLGRGTGDTPTESNKDEGQLFTLSDGTGITAPTWTEIIAWSDGEDTYELGSEYTMPDHNITLSAVYSSIVPNNQIWYTSSDNNKISPNNLESLPALTTNTYEDGKGIYTFTIDITSIGDYAFNGCGFTLVGLPNSITEIGYNSFGNTNYMSNIVLPNELTTLDEYAFYNSGIEYIEIPNNITMISGACFSGCSNLSSVKLNNRVTSLNHESFAGTTNLLSIDLPDTVEMLGMDAFYNSGITSIVLPSSINDLQGSCLSNCSALESVIVLNPVPCSCGIDVFNNTNCIIYVPNGSVDAYKAAEGWSNFADKIQSMPE